MTTSTPPKSTTAQPSPLAMPAPSFCDLVDGKHAKEKGMERNSLHLRLTVPRMNTYLRTPPAPPSPAAGRPRLGSHPRVADVITLALASSESP